MSCTRRCNSTPGCRTPHTRSYTPPPSPLPPSAPPGTAGSSPSRSPSTRTYPTRHSPPHQRQVVPVHQAHVVEVLPPRPQSELCQRGRRRRPLPSHSTSPVPQSPVAQEPDWDPSKLQPVRPQNRPDQPVGA